MNQLKKYLLYLFIGFISLTLVYCVILWVRGVPGHFVVWNHAHNPYSYSDETPYESLYITIKLNGEVVFADSVQSETWDFKSVSTKLNLGTNTIEVYSSEQGIFHFFDQRVFFNSKYDITLDRTWNYFHEKRHVNLEEKENAITQRQIEDYNLKNRERIYFNGINIRHSYWLFYPTTIIE